MRTTVTLIALFLFSVTGFALSVPDAAILNSKGNPYDTISSWYKSAKSIPFSEMNNHVMIGDCFSPLDPSNPTLTMVAALKIQEPGSNRGPAFPRQIQRKVAIFAILNGVENGAREAAFDAMKSNWSNFEPVLTSDNSPLWYNGYLVRGVADSGEIKSFNNYLVTVPKLDQSVKCSADSPPLCKAGQTLKPGTPVTACYFYKDAN